MTEPDVTLTDYALALECLAFVVVLERGRQRAGDLWTWLTLLFASLSLASICGGTVHGFFLDEQSLGQAVLWPAAMLAVGAATLSQWMIGAEVAFSRRARRRILALAVTQFVLYSIAVLFVTREFWVAIADNLPAVVFLFLALGLAFPRHEKLGISLMAIGLALTLVAELLQQIHIGIHPLYFNHNALAHVVQGGALALLFAGGCRLMKAEKGRETGEMASAGAALRPQETANY